MLVACDDRSSRYAGDYHNASNHDFPLISSGCTWKYRAIIHLTSFLISSYALNVNIGMVFDQGSWMWRSSLILLDEQVDPQQGLMFLVLRSLMFNDIIIAFQVDDYPDFATVFPSIVSGCRKVGVGLRNSLYISCYSRSRTKAVVPTACRPWHPAL